MFANPIHESAHQLLQDGKIIEAIEAYSKALKINPENADIYSDRGVAHLHNMDKQKCFADLNKAIDLQPDYAYRYAAMAFAKNNFGDLASRTHIKRMTGDLKSTGHVDILTRLFFSLRNRI